MCDFIRINKYVFTIMTIGKDGLLYWFMAFCSSLKSESTPIAIIVIGLGNEKTHYEEKGFSRNDFALSWFNINL